MIIFVKGAPRTCSELLRLSPLGVHIDEGPDPGQVIQKLLFDQPGDCFGLLLDYLFTLFSTETTEIRQSQG